VPQAFDFQGIGLGTYSQGGYADGRVASLIDRAVANGANSVTFSTVVLADLATGKLGDAIENGVNQTAPLADVGRAVDLAQAAGLQVMLKPQVAVHDAAYDQYNSASWINMVNPDLKIADPAAFFASYKSYLLDWARLAEQHHVSLFSVGNEMVAATKPEFTGYWSDIIAAVRQVYHGQLTYAALAPVVTNAGANEIAQIGFWDKLDVAGFDVYPSLVSTAAPTEAQLEAGWHDASVYGHVQDYAAFIAQMAQKVGKPVIFTETGLPSFDGASDRVATSDGNIGDGKHAVDQQEQADWWQAFFKTWAVNKPSWLKGLVVNNNDPGDLGSYYDTNYNIDGKAAETVVTSWYGGRTTVGAMAHSLAGGQGDDQLYLFGPNSAQAGAQPATQAASLTTTVHMELTGTILSGQAPVIHAYVNGVDKGVFALKAVDSGYVDANGVHYTTDQVFEVTLPGLVKVDQLRLVMDSPAVVGGVRASTFFHAVSVDGVALNAATYTPVAGNGGPYAETMPVNGQGGDVSQWAGGELAFDAQPWNQALAGRAIGSAADPIQVQGGGGSDTLHVLGRAALYTVTPSADGSVRLVEAGGLGQNAVLTGVSSLAFGDGTQVELTGLTAGKSYVFGAGASSGAESAAPVQTAPAPSPTPVVSAPAPAPAAPVVVAPAPAPAPAPSAIHNVEPFSLPHSGAPVNTVSSGWFGGLTGSARNDLLDGHGSARSMSGGAGDDTYVVYHSGDAIREKAGQGVDTALSYSSSYTLAGEVENGVLAGGGRQALTGNSANNDLRSNSAGSSLNGGGGNDILHAGRGADTLSGGAGDDVFQISAAPERAGRIADFTTGHDVLDLRGVFAAAHYQGVNPLADGTLSLQADGAGGTRVLFDPDGAAGAQAPQLLVVLDHVAPSALNAGRDWVFG
jgi:Ca2+-binding RTX toxin-like protein